METKKVAIGVFTVAIVISLGGAYWVSQKGSEMSDSKITEEISNRKKAEKEESKEGLKVDENGTKNTVKSSELSGTKGNPSENGSAGSAVSKEETLDFSSVNSFILSYNSLIHNEGTSLETLDIYSEPDRETLNLTRASDLEVYESMISGLREVSIRKSSNVSTEKIKEVMGSDVQADIKDTGDYIVITNIHK